MHNIRRDKHLVGGLVDSLRRIVHGGRPEKKDNEPPASPQVRTISRGRKHEVVGDRDNATLAIGCGSS